MWEGLSEILLLPQNSCGSTASTAPIRCAWSWAVHLHVE